MCADERLSESPSDLATLHLDLCELPAEPNRTSPLQGVTLTGVVAPAANIAASSGQSAAAFSGDSGRQQPEPPLLLYTNFSQPIRPAPVLRLASNDEPPNPKLKTNLTDADVAELVRQEKGDAEDADHI